MAFAEFFLPARIAAFYDFAGVYFDFDSLLLFC